MMARTCQGSSNKKRKLRKHIGMVWYGLAWCGYGMVWCGMVWYGVVWYGMVGFMVGFVGFMVGFMVGFTIPKRQFTRDLPISPSCQGFLVKMFASPAREERSPVRRWSAIPNIVVDRGCRRCSPAG